MGEQHIGGGTRLNDSELDQVSGGAVAPDADLRKQEQNDKLRKQEQNDKLSASENLAK